MGHDGKYVKSVSTATTLFGKAVWDGSWTPELAAFLLEHRLSERMTDSQRLFRRGYLADIFIEISEPTEVFVSNKIQAFEQYLGFWIICIHPCEPDSFPILQEFPDEPGGEYDSFVDSA